MVIVIFHSVYRKKTTRWHLIDLYSVGSVGAGGKAGNLKAYLNCNGDIYASGNIHVDNSAYINGTIKSGGDINVNKRLNTWSMFMVRLAQGEVVRLMDWLVDMLLENFIVCKWGDSLLWVDFKKYCSLNIFDNTTTLTFSWQISTMNYCQCRQGGAEISFPYIGKLVAD